MFKVSADVPRGTAPCKIGKENNKQCKKETHNHTATVFLTYLWVSVFKGQSDWLCCNRSSSVTTLHFGLFCWLQGKIRTEFNPAEGKKHNNIAGSGGGGDQNSNNNSSSSSSSSNSSKACKNKYSYHITNFIYVEVDKNLVTVVVNRCTLLWGF